jgi:hypothetical protein
MSPVNSASCGWRAASFLLATTLTICTVATGCAGGSDPDANTDRATTTKPAPVDFTAPDNTWQATFGEEPTVQDQDSPEGTQLPAGTRVWIAGRVEGVDSVTVSDLASGSVIDLEDVMRSQADGFGSPVESLAPATVAGQPSLTGRITLSSNLAMFLTVFAVESRLYQLTTLLPPESDGGPHTQFVASFRLL